ncbi:MAG TPA: CotH kinase family protein [Gemmataceae bacterium]|nr:CotH kinase family protein [Gemmataceae bacterium]
MPLRLSAIATAFGLMLAVSGSATAQPAKAGPKNQDDLFGLTKVWTVHLRLTAEAWDTMQPKRGPNFGMPGGKGPAPDDKGPGAPKGAGLFGFDFTYVRGTLDFEGQTYKDIGVRFKGNSSYMMSANGLKRPLKFDFNRFDEEQKFHGLTLLALGNNAFDPSQLREALSYAVYREAGVPAPRTAFVKLYLTVDGKHNREYAGVYTLIEAVNKPFLKRHFGNAKGLLLKPERIQGLPYLGEKWSTYEDRYRPKTEAKPAAQQRLIAFTKLVNNADEATFRKEIAAYLDMDRFLRYLAASTLMVNLDSYQGLGHNYYLYLDAKTNRFTMMPWDLNMSFAGFPPGGGGGTQLTDLSIRQPYMGKNRLIERVLAIKEYDNTYRDHLKKLTETCFSAAKLHADIDAMQRAIAPAVAMEKKGKGGPGFGMMGMMGMPDLKPFVTRRVDSVVAQLAGKSDGAVMAGFGMFGGKGPKGPGGGFGPGMFLAKPILEAADANKDGKVSLAEFKKAAELLFTVCDEGKKGTLDEKALADGINRLLPPPPGFGPPGGPPKGPPGGLPKGPGGFRGPGPILAGSLLKTAGVEKGGKIALAEFVKAAEKLFKEADTDRNGYLDEKEIAAAVNRLFPLPPGFGPPGVGGAPGFPPPPGLPEGGVKK